MNNLLETIKSKSGRINLLTKEYWHYLHSNPELSFNESKTASFVSQVLKENNISVYEGLNGYGLIGIIEGKLSGKTIGIRAELDALPISENTNLDFTSLNQGVMHACGHDIHMASLLGCAIVINELREYLKGKVLVIFESGEEMLPGGATQIIESEVFKKNKPDVMFAFHILPELAAGKAGFREGQYMASGDEIHITVKGKGGHAALPHTTINPIIIASQLLLNLKEFNDKQSPSNTPSILSFGKFIANGATNVIPDDVKIEGTFRTMDENWRKKAHDQIEKISKDVCEKFGGNCIVDIRKGYPSIYNNHEICRNAKELAIEYLGESNVIELEKRMTTDDFAYFSQIIPSVFFRMGVGFENGAKHQLHNSTFMANEDILNYSSGLLAWIAINMLNTNQ